jgi:hypothetical protein
VINLRLNFGKYRHRASIDAEVGSPEYRSLSTIDVLIFGLAAEYRQNIGEYRLNVAEYRLSIAPYRPIDTKGPARRQISPILSLWKSRQVSERWNGCLSSLVGRA